MSETPRTVVHVINTGGPGGAETVCANLARGLDPARWRSVVVVPDDGWITNELRNAGIETRILSHRSRVDVIGYARALSALIKREHATILQGHLFGPTVVLSALGLLHGLPVIGTLHGEMDVGVGERFRRAKSAIVKAGADRLVFVSEQLRRRFVDAGYFSEQSTVVIPNGSRLARASLPGRSPRLREHLGLRDDEFLVGAIGNLRPAKGYDVFLHAAAHLVAVRPGYRFIIAGRWEGSLGEELLELRNALGLRDAVSIIGFREDVLEVMQSLDLCAVTSRSEGFSLVAVEAMAAGVPIVATRCGGPEAILENGRTGVLVENGSAIAVADAIDALRMDPARRVQQSSAARKVALARFTVAAQVTAYERLYESTIAQRGLKRAAGAVAEPI